jgi:hypothetical protein
MAGAVVMSMNRVVLYFDKQEDALLFTVAASSILSDGGTLPSRAAGDKLALEISKANRIKTGSVRNNLKGGTKCGFEELR